MVYRNGYTLLTPRTWHQTWFVTPSLLDFCIQWGDSRHGLKTSVLSSLCCNVDRQNGQNGASSRKWNNCQSICDTEDSSWGGKKAFWHSSSQHHCSDSTAETPECWWIGPRHWSSKSNINQGSFPVWCGQPCTTQGYSSLPWAISPVRWHWSSSGWRFRQQRCKLKYLHLVLKSRHSHSKEFGRN